MAVEWSFKVSFFDENGDVVDETTVNASNTVEANRRGAIWYLTDKSAPNLSTQISNVNNIATGSRIVEYINEAYDVFMVSNVDMDLGSFEQSVGSGGGRDDLLISNNPITLTGLGVISNNNP